VEGDKVIHEKKMLVNVPVATVWTNAESAREIDKEAINQRPNLEAWLSQLTYETRLELFAANLIQTQVLFGQEVLLIGEKNGWGEVVIPEQASVKNKKGYPGYIPLAQLIMLKNEKTRNSEIAVVTAKKAWLLSEKKGRLFQLSFQTELPVLKISENKVTVETPEGIGIIRREDVTIFLNNEKRKKGSGDEIVATGERFLGLPYLWGGMSSYGYDCSGFSYSMYRANGYTIPRDAGDQAKGGVSVPLDEIERGDLLFFAYEKGKGKLHHVGIYYGEGKLLHSPKTGKTVEILLLAGTVYEQELCAARRYWQETEES
jgi:cell wall-associated NlpC family hydrolase